LTEPAFTAALDDVLSGLENTSEIDEAAETFKADWEAFIAIVTAEVCAFTQSSDGMFLFNSNA
jgi:hypothetical protein